MDLKPPLQNVIDDAAHPSNKNSSSSMSTHSTATPDPRWPSKCRWSMQSPPPALTDTVSIEETKAGSELSSTRLAVSDGNEDMRNQIDVIDLESNPKVSTETPSYSGVEPELEPAGNITSSVIISSENKTGEINSVVEPLLEEAGGNVIVSEITSQPENEDYRKTTGLLPITTTTPEIPVDSPVATFVPSIGAWAKPLAFIPPATPPMPATPSGLDPQHLNNLIDSFWPTLTEGLVPNQKKRDHSSVVREFPRMPDSSAEKAQPDSENTLAQSTVASKQLVLQAKISESSLVSIDEAREELPEQSREQTLVHLQSQLSVEAKNLSTPVNNLTYSKVHIANGSNSPLPISPLVDSQSAPTKATTMEEIPSPVIVLEANLVSTDKSLVPPSSHEHGSPFTRIACNKQDDERGYMSDATANLNMSRGGRPIKPLQKFQDMEWKTVRGRGKKGRRGRGNYLPSS
ncbi:unnamed protein product [Brassica rapa subsp. narinosa]